MKVKTKKKISPLMIALLILLIVYTVALLFPIAWGLLTSFKHILDFGSLKHNVLGFPNWDVWKLDKTNVGGIFGNYYYAYKYFEFEQSDSYIVGIFNQRTVAEKAKYNILGCLVNTVLYAGVTCFIMAFVPMYVAYLCARYRYKMSSIIYAVVVFVMTIPIVGSTPSHIELMRKLSIFNTFPGEWLRRASFTGMYFLVYYAFFRGMSDAYAEAAEIDGASQFRVMTTIYFPLARTIYLTVALLIFVNLWNDFNTPMLFLPTKATLAYGIYYVTNIASGTLMSETPRKIALLMMFCVPILVLFVFFKDKLMGNLTMGGVKG